jgi:hypothetical protein
MQLVDGHLFDGEWYERTELLRGSFAGESGFCVVLWPSDVAGAPDESRPKLMGPFRSADIAYTTAKELG